ncbi:hypothetical protein ARMSODRAFT_1009853 [Armillaria solidipes]|uniref:Uncharacterized protein n=1 Tax=Armillaria solidipes TaxID=1076256 RepID=A0A2H3AZH2_9AGAR|nr:hypothetical protein ARMSODRAFT_1009853 [Armillaria solidipes]
MPPPLYYLDLKKKHGAEEEEALTEECQCLRPSGLKVDTNDVFFDKDVFEGAKEKLGCYLEELPSEKGGWGTMDGPARDAACGRSVRDRLDDGCRCIYTDSSRESPQGCLRRTHRSDCTRIHHVSPSTTTSTTRPTAISTSNTWSTLPMDRRLTSSRQIPMRNDRFYARKYDCTARWNTWDDGWLCTRFVLYPATSEDRWDTQQLLNSAGSLAQTLCLSRASRWASPPSLMPLGVLTTAKSSVECQHNGKWWGERAREEDVLGISADRPPWRKGGKRSRAGNIRSFLPTVTSSRWIQDFDTQFNSSQFSAMIRCTLRDSPHWAVIAEMYTRMTLNYYIAA